MPRHSINGNQYSGIVKIFRNDGLGISENLKDVLGVHTPRDISKLSAKEWTWKNPEVSQGVQIGYIAQEVEKYLPEAVEVSEGVKTLNYNAVHTSKIANLERELQELKLLVKELTNGRTN